MGGEDARARAGGGLSAERAASSGALERGPGKELDEVQLGDNNEVGSNKLLID